MSISLATKGKINKAGGSTSIVNYDNITITVTKEDPVTVC